MMREDDLSENSVLFWMSWFGAFRNHYGFTWYGDKRTKVTMDFPLLVVTYLCLLLAVATLISTLGIRGRERWATTLRASYAVGIGSIILVCLVGHDWLVGSTEVTTHYLYRTSYHFQGIVGVRIGLTSCNATLEGVYRGASGEGNVSYSESTVWRDYGKEREVIGYYLQRGLPHPLLTVMDFLSVDSGGLRWGRSYHSAGYFSWALLWTAFVFWIISNVLLLSVICYGAFMFFFTGVAMVLSCIVYHVCQPPLDLRIDFGNSILTTYYGWCYWLTLTSGIITIVLGSLLFTLDYVYPEKMSELFNLESLDEQDGSDLNGNGTFTKIAKQPSRSLQEYNRRRASDQHLASDQRRPSIFLEAQRQPSDLTGNRSCSFLSNYSSNSLAVSSKSLGFEQQRTKSNPLFNGSTEDIPEEQEEVCRPTLVHLQVGGEQLACNYGNRKPSLATMREHRENHMNERQQQSSQYIISPICDTPASTASVVVHCSLDGAPQEDSILKRGPRVSDDVILNLTEVEPLQAVGAGGDGCSDSAIGSGEGSSSSGSQKINLWGEADCGRM